MGDGYAPRFPRRLRVGFAAASVLVSVPALIAEPLAGGPIAVQAAAFWWLGARPRLGTGGVLLASAGLQLLAPEYGPGLAFFALCTYAWLRPAAETTWMLGPAVLAVSGPAALRDRWDLAGLWLGAVALAWSWGALARARGARRQAERRQAVLEERARIARELHDVLSHTVSVMVVQAAAADDVFEVDPVRAREAIRRTEETGRQALTELRFFLRAVHDPDETAVAGSSAAARFTGTGAAAEFAGSGAAVGVAGPETSSAGGGSTTTPAGEGFAATSVGGPQPTLADLDRLAASLGEAGLPVTVVREGSGQVPLGVQLNAYRIVQEALTNTLRHARAAQAEVLLRITESEVSVQVRDTPRDASVAATLPHKSGKSDLRNGSEGGGHGLRGMRERAELLGGSLTAGPRAGGGFEVTARLPRAAS